MTERTVGIGHNRPPVPCPIPGQPWPQDAQALIFRRTQPVTTSGKAGTGQWILRFERRLPQTIEPLMGWTADDDTLTQVELRFSSIEEAIAYAEREGLAYRVQGEAVAATRADRERARKEAQQREAADLYMTAAALAWMDAQYGVAAVGRRPDLDRALADPASVFAAPSEVVHDPSLPMDDKREILCRWVTPVPLRSEPASPIDGVNGCRAGDGRSIGGQSAVKQHLWWDPRFAARSPSSRRGDRTDRTCHHNQLCRKVPR